MTSSIPVNYDHSSGSGCPSGLTVDLELSMPLTGPVLVRKIWMQDLKHDGEVDRHRCQLEIVVTDEPESEIKK